MSAALSDHAFGPTGSKPAKRLGLQHLRPKERPGTATIPLGETCEAGRGRQSARPTFQLRGRHLWSAWGGGWLWAGTEALRDQLDALRDACGSWSQRHRRVSELRVWQQFADRLEMATSEADVQGALVEAIGALAQVDPSSIDVLVAQQGPAKRSEPAHGPDSQIMGLRFGGRQIASVRLPFAVVGSGTARIRRQVERLLTVGAASWAGLTSVDRVGPVGGESRAVPLRDAVTGLPDRHWMEAVLVQLIEQAGRRHAQVAVLVVEPRGLSEVRGELGSMFADAAMGLVTRAVLGTLRATDPASRIDADRLAIALPGASRAAALRVAAALRKSIAEAGLTSSTPRPLTAAVGVSAYPEDGTEAAALIAAARDRLTPPPRNIKRIDRDEACVETGSVA